MKELDPKPDRSGNTVQLTIDQGLQQYAAPGMGDQSAALVVNGRGERRHAGHAVSMPAFDPNNFTEGIGNEPNGRCCPSDDHVPLLDKVAQGLYPSGSTIKPAMAMALLKRESTAKRASTAPAPSNSVITRSTATGATDRSIWTLAVVHSCDVYFYTMCLRVGAENLSPMIRSMGFGEKFDLPFDNQRFGTIPDPEWMMRKYHRKWQGYDTVNMSIGQGMVLDQSAAAGGDGQPPRDRKAGRSAPAQEQAGRAADPACGRSRTI